MRDGYVRVTNYRKDMAPDSQAEDGEIVIPVDRRNPVLGNRHILRNKFDPRERQMKIRAFKIELDADIQASGPMSKAIDDIVTMIAAGGKVCLECCCRPLPCHGDIIADEINRRLGANPL